MKRIMLSATLIVASLVPILGQTQNKNSLVGTWKLVTYEDSFSNGEIKYPYGKNPHGLLIYDANGYMAIQIMKVPHPKVASDNEDKVTTEEKIALFDSYVAYYGTYAIDWKRRTVTHKVEGDLYDVYVGTSQERPFELKGTV